MDVIQPESLMKSADSQVEHGGAVARRWIHKLSLDGVNARQDGGNLMLLRTVGNLSGTRSHPYNTATLTGLPKLDKHPRCGARCTFIFFLGTDLCLNAEK